jgi:hypothetical protein
MVIGKKFWPIGATTNTIVNYAPAANAGIGFSGTVNGTSITGVNAAIVSAIAGLGTTGDVGITGNYISPGTTVTAATGTTLTLSTASSGSGTLVTNLTYFDTRYPSSANGDAPIQALLCLDSTHGPFEFYDERGILIQIPGSTLVKGAVYYWQIAKVYNATAADFIGYSAN